MTARDAGGRAVSDGIKLGRVNGGVGGDYRVGVYCATCMRRYGIRTLLAVMSHPDYYPDGSWAWARAARPKQSKEWSLFTLPTDPKYATGGAQLGACRRCRAQPRVNLDRLAREADAAMAAGVSGVNV